MATTHNTRSPSSCLIVAGMHRSGTSLMGSMLVDAGIQFGDQLTNAGHGNSGGFFEDSVICRIHEQSLEANGINSQGFTNCSEMTFPLPARKQAEADSASRRRSSTHWGWKQPRATLFLDEWAKLVPEAKFLLVFRRPWDVVDSLYRRGDHTFFLRPPFALRVWETYNKAILHFATRHKHRSFVIDAAQLVTSPTDVLRSLQEWLRIDLELLPENLKKEQFSSLAIGTRVEFIRKFETKAMSVYLKLCQLSGSRPAVEPWTESVAISDERRDLFFREWQHSSSEKHNPWHHLQNDTP